MADSAYLFLLGVASGVAAIFAVDILRSSYEQLRLRGLSLTGRYETTFEEVDGKTHEVVNCHELLTLRQRGKRFSGESEELTGKRRRWRFAGSISPEFLLTGSYEALDRRDRGRGTFVMKWNRAEDSYVGSWTGFAHDHREIEQSSYVWRKKTP